MFKREKCQLLAGIQAKTLLLLAWSALRLSWGTHPCTVGHAAEGMYKMRRVRGVQEQEEVP